VIGEWMHEWKFWYVGRWLDGFWMNEGMLDVLMGGCWIDAWMVVG
jgi:hypothetical protein